MFVLYRITKNIQKTINNLLRVDPNIIVLSDSDDEKEDKQLENH